MLKLRKEFWYRTSRSQGPGGQHANKTETRVTALFDVYTSKVLSLQEKNRLSVASKSRISTEGVLHVSISSERSQFQNKAKATLVLEKLIITGIEKPKKRKKSTPTRASRLKRVKSKKEHGEKKKRRRADKL